MSDAKLRIEGLVKSHGDRVVLNGVDLDVDDHEVMCLIGTSGSGKSTLLRCIDLLDPIDAGRILLDGVEITAADANANEVRKRVGIVFQSFNLFPHMTAIDNVTLGPRKVHKISRADAEAKAEVVMKRLGLVEKMRHFPDQLSGGQQQRVAIARALVAEPEVLLLDEITSALDPELVGEVLATIRELADQGLTMVLATHEMGFARDVANRVAFLHEGRILECGPPSQVLGEPTHERTQQFLRRIIQAGRL
ncbi:MAG: amino acid ABC transporter ATP-binding protein [Actinobacteria bacterium]|nr:amino acid ABC transporter ATP-binding protein [Actinomycetota bacterium]